MQRRVRYRVFAPFDEMVNFQSGLLGCQQQSNGASPLERLIFQSEKIVVQARFRQRPDINVVRFLRPRFPPVNRRRSIKSPFFNALPSPWPARA